LTVEYGKGCSLSDNITIFIDSSSQSVKIPDAFSPNGDGINDFFYIQQNGISDFEFVIFDRWGGIVYKTDNPDFKWDGTSSGNILSSGNYLYSTRYKFFNKNEFESKKGYITLLK
jgi:gliding motility-associated-like protein